VGAGKTGIDAILWLMTNDVNPARISWIMPRDWYFFQRENLQPLSSPFAGQAQASGAALNKAVMKTSSMEDLLKRWVECGQLL